MTPPAIRRTVVHVAITWAALMTLMLLSLGTAYLRLGVFNTVSGLVIAAIKAAIVIWLFMRLRSASSLIRVVAVVGIVLWFVLAALSGIDYLTRSQEPSTLQPPQQLPALRSGLQGH